MAGLRTQKRRRKENKTDYKNRLNLLKSGLKRIVVRQTNKYFLIQLVESFEAKDKVIVSVSSRDLLKEGFNKKYIGSLKSIPAGYSTALLFSNKINKNENYIIDIGMARNIYGNRNSAVIKGLVDGQVKINVDKKVFPTNERLEGNHLKDDVKKEFEKINKIIMSKNGK